MNTTTVFVTAGTNVGATVMSPEDRAALRNAIRAAIADNGGAIFLDGIGQGTWEGVSESSYVIGATFPVKVLGAELRADLVLIARRFGQDAIGLTIHDSLNYGESYVSA